MQLSDVRVKLSPNGWHRRLQVYTFGANVPLFPNLCPHFWLTIACLFISPFKFVPLLLWAGVKVGALGAFKGIDYGFVTPWLWCWQILNNKVTAFYNGTCEAVDKALPGIKRNFKAFNRASDWVLNKIVGPVTFGVFWFMLKCFETWALLVEFLLVNIMWKGCVALYRSPHSPLRPIRWFLRARYTRMVMEGNEKMLLGSLAFMERWMDKLIPLNEDYEGRNIYELTEEDWVKLEARFYETLAEKYQGRKGRYSYQYYQVIRHWQFLQATRNLNTDWESVRNRTIDWKEHYRLEREAAAKQRRQQFVNIATTAQTIGGGLFLAGKYMGIAVAVCLGAGVLYTAGYYGWQAIQWILNVGAPGMWELLGNSWGWTLYGIYYAWANAGDYIQLVIFLTGFIFLWVKAIVALDRKGFWSWSANTIIIPVLKGLNQSIGFVGSLIERPTRWVLKRTVAPAFKNLWAGLSFFGLYLKAAKQNQCPGIEWEE